MPIVIKSTTYTLNGQICANNKPLQHIIFRGNTLIRRGNYLIFRGNTLIRRGNYLIFRGNTLIRRGNTLIFRGNTLIRRGNYLIFRGNTLFSLINSFLFSCFFITHFSISILFWLRLYKNHHQFLLTLTPTTRNQTELQRELLIFREP